MAVQLAAKVAKLNVIATASRPESSEWIKKLGASKVLNHNNPLDGELKAQGSDTVDYVLVLSSIEQHWAAVAKVIAPGGHVASIVPSRGAALDLNLLRTKSASFSWEVVFTRSIFHTADLAEQQRTLDAIAKLVDDG